MEEEAEGASKAIVRQYKESSLVVQLAHVNKIKYMVEC